MVEWKSEDGLDLWGKHGTTGEASKVLVRRGKSPSGDGGIDGRKGAWEGTILQHQLPHSLQVSDFQILL